MVDLKAVAGRSAAVTLGGKETFTKDTVQSSRSLLKFLIEVEAVAFGVGSQPFLELVCGARRGR